MTVVKAWIAIRPIKRLKERRARKRDEAAAAGGEYLYEEDEPMLKNVLKGKLTYASVVALVLGLVAELVGIDIAPTEVDAIVTALATLGAFYGRYRASRA